MAKIVRADLSTTLSPKLWGNIKPVMARFLTYLIINEEFPWLTFTWIVDEFLLYSDYFAIWPQPNNKRLSAPQFYISRCCHLSTWSRLSNSSNYFSRLIELLFSFAMWLGISCELFHHFAHGKEKYHSTSEHHGNMSTGVAAIFGSECSRKHVSLSRNIELGMKPCRVISPDIQVAAHFQMDLWTHSLGLRCINRKTFI